MGDQLSEDQRHKVYWSLLSGLAKECQDRLCASDEQHAWSEVSRTRLEHDIPLHFDPNEPMVCNETYKLKHERHCLNCGKEEIW